MLQDGISLTFMCRMPNCMFYGLNDQWVPNRVKHQFKCPMCGEQYRPGSDEKGAVKAGFVLQLGIVLFGFGLTL